MSRKRERIVSLIKKGVKAAAPFFKWKAEDAVQLQSNFAKSAYEDFIAQSTKIAEMYSD